VNELFVLLLDLLRGQRVPLDASLATSERTVGLFLSELVRRPDALAHPWSVGEMAEQCGLGVTYFIRYCRQITNMTPAKYLGHHRLRRASELLRGEGELTIAEIARHCGFASPRYFASAFRRAFHCTPTEFRSRRG
jgi:AraC family L-rhamnose operon regulatory protein RhaS